MYLTPRNRLQLVLSGQVPDRVPVSPFVQEEYLSYFYPNKTKLDRVFDALELAKELNFDLIAKPRTFEFPHFLQKSFTNWQLRQDQHVQNGKIYICKTIETPKKTLTQLQVGPDFGFASGGVHLSTQEYFLKTPEDIEIFIEFLPEIDLETITEMKNVTAEWRKAIGENGIVAPWGWCSVFNMASEYRNIELLMMDTFDIPELYSALMEQLSAQMAIYNAYLAQTNVECIGIQGNIANGALFSSDYFTKYIESYEKMVIDAIHSCGAFTIYHNCGMAKNLYPNYKRMGFTVWETVSESLAGDNTLQEAKNFFGQTMCLLGNLDQVSFLKTASVKEVVEKTRNIIDVGKPNGHYIFSTSDFIEKDTPLQNVKAMIDTARDMGSY